MLLRNTVLPAGDALALGLVERVVPDVDVEDAVLEEAAALAYGPRAAAVATKRLLAHSATASLDEHLDAEAASIAERIASPEGEEGISAFLARRRPDYPVVDTERRPHADAES